MRWIVIFLSDDVADTTNANQITNFTANKSFANGNLRTFARLQPLNVKDSLYCATAMTTKSFSLVKSISNNDDIFYRGVEAVISFVAEIL